MMKTGTKQKDANLGIQIKKLPLQFGRYCLAATFLSTLNIQTADAAAVTPTLSAIKDITSAYIQDATKATINLTDTEKGTHTNSVRINGQTYYFTPTDEVKDTITKLVNTGYGSLYNQNDTPLFPVFAVTGNTGTSYYSYNSETLPESSYSISEGTSQNYNFTTSDGTTTSYYKTNLSPSNLLNTVNGSTVWIDGAQGSNKFSVVLPNNETRDFTYGYNKPDGWGDGERHVYEQNGNAAGNSTFYNNRTFNGLDSTVSGGAIYIQGNYQATEGHGSNLIGTMTADFINNSITNTDTSEAGLGGALHIWGPYAGIETLNANFINNHITYGTAKSGGGALAIGEGYNGGESTVGLINGNFINNYIEAPYNNFGGAIYYEGSSYGDGEITSIGQDSLHTTKFVGNHISGSGQGGAIYAVNKIGSIYADFIGNYIAGSSDNSRGGAITLIKTSDEKTVGSITGDFIGNYITTSANNGSAWGGAIYNNNSVGSITGDFIGNYVASEQDQTYGGAIYNGNPTNNKGTITNLTGNFIGNYANGKNVYGGAIYNTGTITTLNGNFIENDAYSNVQYGYNAVGGAIANKSNGVIESISGDFIRNKVHTSYTSNSSMMVSGGAIYNEGAKIGTIEANFIENEAQREAGAIYNNGDSSSNKGIDAIVGNFIKNKVTGEFARNSRKGGAIYNADYGYIGYIGGEFIGNSITVDGLGGKGLYGGAIANSDNKSHIDGIDGVFDGNYLEAKNSTSNNNLYGGAIYNGGSDAFIGTQATKSYTEYVFNPDTFESEPVEKEYTYVAGGINDSVFKNNHVVTDKGNAYGGAIYNENSSGKGAIGSIQYVLFDNNSANSTNGTAQGGAVYNNGVIGTVNEYDIVTSGGFIDTSFINNSAKNEGGAIYNSAKAQKVLIVAETEQGVLGTEELATLGITEPVSVLFKGNSASNGASIYNASTGNTEITAEGGNIIFTDNNPTSADGYGIYSKPTVTLAAKEGYKVKIDDSINIVNNYADLTVNQGQGYNGTVELNGNITFSGNNSGIRVGASGNVGDTYGTLKLGQTPANEVYQYLVAMGDFTLDLQNNHAGDNMTISSLSGVGNTKLNLEYDATNNIMDKLTVNGAVQSEVWDSETSSFVYKYPTLTLNAVNVLNDKQDFVDGTKATYLDGAASQNLNVISSVVTSTTVTQDGSVYVFTPDELTKGILSVTRGIPYTGDLINAINDDIAEIHPNAFSMNSDFHADRDFGALSTANRDSFTIYGNNKTIDANGKEGITLAKGQELTISGVREFSGTNGVAISNSGGKLNIQNSTFTNNIVTPQEGDPMPADIMNTRSGDNTLGTLNVSDSTLDAIYNDSVMNLSGSNSIANVYDVPTVNGGEGDRIGVTNITGGTSTFTGAVEQKTINLSGGRLKVDSGSTLAVGAAADTDSGIIADALKSVTYAPAEGDARGGVINNAGTISNIKGLFKGNSIATEDVNAYAYGGAIYNTSQDMGAINASFTENKIITKGNAAGAAISNVGGKIASITGDFTGNIISQSENDRQAYGGAIHNVSNAEIGDISGSFTNNSVTSTATGVQGGAIYTVNSTIGDISGSFTGNIAKSQTDANAAHGNAYGGAINVSGSTIGDIIADFTGNKAITTKPGEEGAFGGAIYSVGYNGNSQIGDIKGKFDSNEAKSGGAIFNSNGSTINSIAATSSFENNKALNYGGAIFNKGTIKALNADFTGNTIETTENAHGGAISNVGGAINSITGDFKDNAISLTENVKEAYGGAIHNIEGGQIGDITGDFENNTVTATTTGVQGGAIYNVGGSSKIGDIKGNFTGNIAKSQTDSTAQYSNADGGAIIASMYSDIKSITGNFTGNKAITTNPNSDLARGGAIYTAWDATIGDIKGKFEANEAKKGAAIYNSGRSIGDILATSSFVDNKGVYEGAIANHSTIGNIIADFTGNRLEADNAQGGQFLGAAITNGDGTIGDIQGTISGNYVKLTNSQGSNRIYGGAIFNNRNIGTVENEVITGGIKNSTITGNYIQTNGSEQQVYGGAIATQSQLNIIDTDITGNYIDAPNTSNTKGGAIWSQNGITITANTASTATAETTQSRNISGNYGTENGAAIYNHSSDVVLNAAGANIIFENNDLLGNGTGTGVGIYSGGGLTVNSSTDNYVALNDALNIQGITTLNGNLKLGDKAVETLANTTSKLTLNSGTLDIANGVIDNMSFANAVDVQGATNLALDVNATSTGILADYINANIISGNTQNISISSINFMNDIADDFSVNIASGAIGSLIKTAATVDIVNSLSNYDVNYVFENNIGTLNFELITYANGINEAVTASDREDKKYVLRTDEHVTAPLGALVGTSLTVSGKEHKLFGTTETAPETKLGGFEIADGQTLTLNNMTVQDFNTAVNNKGTTKINNITFSNNVSAGNGGAVNNTGNIEITNSTLTGNNAASMGGAIYMNTKLSDGTQSGGVADIINSQFVQNNSDYIGGAIFLHDGEMNIKGSTFDSNTSKYGGAIYTASRNTIALTIEDSIFKNNEAEGSGALGAMANVSISNSQFLNNSSTLDADGGGAVFIGSIGNTSIAGNSVSNSLFKENTAAKRGGAISTRSFADGNNSSAKLDITNTQFISNAAGTTGGAIDNYLYHSTADGHTDAVYITGSTFAGNTANQGGAIYNHTGKDGDVLVDSEKQVGKIYIANSEFTNNRALSSKLDDLVETTDSFAKTALKDANGNLVKDASNKTVYTNSEGVTNALKTVTTEQFTDEGKGGAIYNEGTLTLKNVTFGGADGETSLGNTANSGGAIYNKGTLIFEENVTFANNSAKSYSAYKKTEYSADYNDTTYAWTASNTSTKYGGKGGAIYSAADLTVNGEFLNNSAEVAGGAIYAEANLTASGTFTGNTSNTSGAAIQAKGSEIHVSNATFSGNIAKGGGGAIYTKSTTGVIGGTFEANQSNDGGAVFVAAMPSGTTANYTISEGSTFNSNISTQHGGALYFDTRVIPVIGDNVTFEGNKANKKGGAVYVNVGNSYKATLGDNVKFIENTAENGGAISANFGSIDLGTNALFKENSAEMLGGAVHYTAGNSSTTGGGLILGSSTFKDNSAVDGGAVYYKSTRTAETFDIGNGVKFEGNHASRAGGAIAFDTASTQTVNINGATFDGNYSDVTGGAIVSYDGAAFTLNVNENSTFTNNYTDAEGGAIVSDSILNVTSAEYSKNYTTGTEIGTSYLDTNEGGGAIFMYDSSVAKVENSTFEENTSGTFGGAISTRGISNGASGSASTLTVLTGEFEENSAKYGGAIASAVATTITGTEFEENTATIAGGAIYQVGKTLDITDANFEGNIASKGAAVYAKNSAVTINAKDDNVQFKDNTSADAKGSGIEIEGGSLALNANAEKKLSISDIIKSDVDIDINSKDNYTGIVALSGDLNLGENTLNVKGGTLELAEASVNSLTAAITQNLGVVDLKGGTIAQNIAGSTTISGEVISSAVLANVTVAETGDFTTSASGFSSMANDGKLTLTSGNLEAAVTGDGTTYIDGSDNVVKISATGSIAQAIEVKSGTLQTGVNGFNQAIQVNAGAVELTGEGTIDKNISGATKISGNILNGATLENVTVAETGEFTTDASKFTTLANSGVLNLEGVLDKSITGIGTTKVKTLLTMTTGDIDGIIDINSGTLSLIDNNVKTYTPQKLKGEGNLKIDIVKNDTGIVSDTIKASSYEDIDITVTEIAGLDSVMTGNESFNLNLFDGYEGDGLKIAADIVSAHTGTKNVDRSKTDELTQTANWTDKFGESTWQDIYTEELKADKGAISYTIEKTGETTHVYAEGDTLQMLNTTTNFGTSERKMITDDKAALYEVAANLGVTSEGTMTVKGAKDETDISTIDMKGNTGFVVSNENTTLNLDTVHIKGAKDEDGSLINNQKGTVNINDVKIAENSKDVIKNDSTLNLTGKNEINSGIKGDGTTNVKSGESIISRIAQKAVEIFTGAKLTTEAVTAENGVNNNGEIELKGSTNSSDINGEGKTVVSANLNNTGAINQKTVEIAEGKTLTTTGDVTISDTMINKGAITVNNKDAENKTALNLNGSNMQNEGEISGTGTTVINGSLENKGDGSIASAVKIATSGSLTTDASKITGGVENNAQNGLNLTGGNLASAITGEGSTVISGDVTNTGAAAINNNIAINQDASLSTIASAIGGAVDNSGNLELSGGELTKAVQGTGSTKVSGDVTASAAIAQNINIQSGTMTASADNIQGAVNNSSTLKLTDGELKQNVTGTGTTQISGDVKNSANIESATNITSGSLDNTNGKVASVTVSSGTSLTSSADNVTGTVNNSGNYNVTGGTIGNAVTGAGNTNIQGNTTVAAAINGNVNVSEGITLNVDPSTSIASAAKVALANGSTLDVSGNTLSGDTVNNISVASGNSANIAMDWGDQISTNNIAGTLNITSMDLTNTSATTAPYSIATGSNLANVSVSSNINLKTTDTSFNTVKYSSVDTLYATAGTLTGSRSDLAQAVNTTEAGESAVYAMSSDEKAGATAPGILDGGKLVVQGNGNTITENGIIVGDGVHSADLTLKDANMDTTGNAIEINDGSVTFKAENQDVTIDGDIISHNSTNKVTFTGNKTIDFNGLFDPAIGIVDGATVNRGGLDSDIAWTITNGTLRYLKDSYLNNTANKNSVTMNGGTLDTINGVVTDFQLAAFNVNADSNVRLDVDLANQKMDNFDSSTSITVAPGAKLHVNGLNLLSDAIANETSVNFTSNGTLMGAVDYTGASSITALAPIYKYNVAYDNGTGNFNFSRFATGGYGDFNPSIMAAPVGAQLGGYLTQLNSYDEAFRNMDMYMLMTKKQRQALKFKNKYAAADGNLIYDPTTYMQNNKNGWFRPYVTFENVGLKNGPKVDNIAYGTFLGGESEMYDLGHGWDGMWGAYLGYNGSHQNYDGVSIYQNGGTLGLVGMAYKGNFFTGLTANVGASAAEASAMYGKEDFAMLMTGVASKTGYNFEFADGKFILQPSLMLSYSMVNTFDYHNAAGVRVKSDPLNAIQVEPGIKLIGNLKNGWQPYMGVSMVWNIMDKTKFKANDISLPDLSVKPYVRYGVGVRKTWGERFTGFLQAFVTNGGRNGVGLQGGFSWSIGKDYSKSSSEKKEQKTSSSVQKKPTKITLKGLD